MSDSTQTTTAQTTRPSQSPPPSGLLQRQCACGQHTAAGGECAACRQKQQGALQRSPSGLAINRPGDRYEQEAERVAAAVLSGGELPGRTLSSGPALRRDGPPAAPSPRDPSADERRKYPGASLPDLGFNEPKNDQHVQQPPEKLETNEDRLGAAGEKLAETFLETTLGKQLADQAEKFGEGFISTLPSLAVSLAIAASTVATMALRNEEFPLKGLVIKLPQIAPGLKVKLTYKGPLSAPTEAGISFAYEPAASKKPQASDTDRTRADTERIAADQAKFQKGAKTPAERAAEQRQLDAIVRGRQAQSGNILGIPGLTPRRDDRMLQRDATGASDLAVAPSIVHDVLSSPGQPLDPATRLFMEPRFGHDFSGVRVHTDGQAAASARDVSANAYTVGRNMVFGAGRFAPETHEGRRLIAHELTHVVQQTDLNGIRAGQSNGKDSQSNIFPLAQQNQGEAEGSSDARTALEVPAKLTSEMVIQHHNPLAVWGSNSRYLARDPAPIEKPEFPDNPIFISEQPKLLESWKEGAKGVMERELKKKFNSFEDAQKGFREHLDTLPSDAAREEYADRMRDRVRKAFWRAEYRSAKEGRSAFRYTDDQMTKMENGAAPTRVTQLEHMEEVKTKPRPGGGATTQIPGRPERALDPENVYTTMGGTGGTAPKGTPHAEKWRQTDAAVTRSRELGGRTGPPSGPVSPPTPAEANPQAKQADQAAPTAPSAEKSAEAKPAPQVDTSTPSTVKSATSKTDALPRPKSGARPSPIRTAAGRKPNLRVLVPRGGAGRASPTTPRGRGGSPSGSVSAGMVEGLSVALIAILNLVVASYLFEELDPMYRKADEKTWQESLQGFRPRLERVVSEHAQQIQWWQEDGREVSLHAAVSQTTQNLDYGLSRLDKVEMTDVKLAAEGLPAPALKLVEPGVVEVILRGHFEGFSIKAQTLEFVLEGTRSDVRRLREIGERLAARSVGEQERSQLREERDRLTDVLPNDVLPPGPHRELAATRPISVPVPTTSAVRAAAIAAKRREIRGLELPSSILNSEQRADVGERLRTARVELRLLEFEERRGGPVDAPKRAEVARLLQDVVFYEWKAERERLPANERASLENMRQLLDEMTTSP